MFRRRWYHPLAKLIGSYLCLALWAYVTVYFMMSGRSFWAFLIVDLVFLITSAAETEMYIRYRKAKKAKEKDSGEKH